MNDLRAMQARRDIHDLVLRYCRAIDRRDFAAVRSVYCTDGVDHHTGFSGTADAYVTWVHERLADFTGTMHIAGNHLSWVVGERAVAETYGTAVHWAERGDDSALNFTSGFRYVDRLRIEDGVWRIEERFAIREWTRSEAGRWMSPEAEGPRSAPGEDLVSRLLETLRD